MSVSHREFYGETPDQKREKREARELEFYKIESDKLAKIKAGFLEGHSKEILIKYVRKWFCGVYGEQTLKTLTEHGLTLCLFEKPALFDLVAAGSDSNKAIQIGINKAMRLENGL